MSSTIDNFDIVVVGAGFAGLACARVAAANGIKTLVLERKQCPGENIRTTGILVKEAADIIGLPETMAREIPGVRLYSPNGNFVDLCSPGYSFVATDTPAMMRWMADKTRMAGAEIRLGQNVAKFATRDGGIELPNQEVSTNYLLGCDGARSNVAKQFDLGQNTKFLVGAEVEYQGVRDLHPDRLHVFLDSVLAPGYIGWVVPGAGIAQVGIAVNQGCRLDLPAFEARIQSVFDFSEARVVGRRGGLIPCGGLVNNWHDGNVMLLGDAAGMVSPLTAGGIHPSVEIGRETGAAFAKYLTGEGPHPAEAIGHVLPSYRTKGLLRWAMNHVSPPNCLYNVMLGNPLFRRFAQLIFFHHRGLLSPAAWREMVNLPRSSASRSHH